MMSHTYLPNKTDIAGYQIVEQLYLSSRTVVYRAVQERDRQPVIVKLLSQEYPSSIELVQFRHQYTITKHLTIPGIVCPIALESWRNGYILVMADCQSISLRQYTSKQLLSQRQILAIAIQLADILHALDRQGIVHKDIKPDNILIHPDTQQVKLIDFSIASHLPKETQGIEQITRLEGTLPYIAPEQTGRMNRGIDYRTDFYGLGVTLYQLLTGELPFKSLDPLELVHCHLAKAPPLPHQIQPQIPPILSAIVLKLMAKNAEDRYQTALGFKYDLEQCLERGQGDHTIADFKLGQRDFSDRFSISERLYGRESEVRRLLAAFDRVSSGGNVEMLLVAGFSGIGKTAVINEVHKPILRQRGYFIKGKFDQFNRNIPLCAFVQALRDLVGQLLSESDAQLAGWKTKILTALGDNGRIAIDVIPELERIVGAQPPVPELVGNAAQQRFNLLFQKFIQVFATPAHPLTIFIDDLQWADLASLKLLPLLMKDAGYLLILGAYRDNEVSSVHPLMLTVRDLRETGARIDTISLKPLLSSEIDRLVADTLNCDRALARPLTKLVYQKTQGNPFFITQFLKALHQDNLIVFNASERVWQCDISQIEVLSLTDDVVEFMAGQLQRLPPQTQSVLTLAACIGAQFDLQTLAIVCERSISDTATALWAALHDGLIVPLDRIYKFFQADPDLQIENAGNLHQPDPGACTYRFLHDRVQQAAYLLMPPDRAAAIHQQIGRLLLARTPAADLDAHIFQIVNQLNYGGAEIADPSERQTLAQLNRQAGQKAKNATAYDAAMKYLDRGLELLSSQAWQTAVASALEFHQLAAEVAYLNGNYDRAIELIEIGLQHTNQQLDRAKFYEIQILCLIAQNQARAAVIYARKVLKHFGVYLPEHPSPIKTVLGFAIAVYRMRGKTPQDLLKLPMMSEPLKLAGYNILNAVGAAATARMPEMLPFITFAGIDLNLRYGNIPTSSMGYTIYAYLICDKLGWIDTGYAIGQGAIELCHQTGSKAALAKTLVIWNHFIAYRKSALRDTLPLMLEAYQVSLEVGDVEYAAYSLSAYLHQAYWCGQNLQDLQQEAIAYRPGMLSLQQHSISILHDLNCQGIVNLTTPTDDVCQLVGDWFDRTRISDTDLREMQMPIGLRKLHLAVIFERYTLGLAQISAIESEIESADPTFLQPIFYFYSALARLGAEGNLQQDRQKTLTKVKKARQKLAKLAKSAPLNYQHQVLLLDAECLRRLGKSTFQVAGLYDRAIVTAQINGYTHDEALANELAARFYLDRGQQKFAQTYLIEAYYAYTRWGATTKIKDLEHRYPELLLPILAATRQPNLDRTSSYSVSNSSQNLDLATLLTASQAICSQIELDRLLITLLNTVITNAGADKGVLLLQTAQDLELAAVVEDGQQPQIFPVPIPLAASHDRLPITIVNRVKRNLEPVVLINDRENMFADDVYLQQHHPKSILCSPILKQGKSIGILYLENQLTAGVFTKDRLEVLKFLSAQIAISLENARLYQQAQQTNEELIRANRLKDEFLATMSHELRTPLNAILGMTEGLTEQVFGTVTDRQIKALATISRSGSHLLELINDILDVAKIESRHLELSFEPTPVAVICESSLAIIEQQAHKKQITLETNLPPNLPTLMVDERRIRQVAIDLLDNAVKFTPPGGKITLAAQQSRSGFLQISVTDTGIGISPENIHKLFQPFSQIDSTLNRQYQGTGLGLALVKRIVELHGGAVHLTSTVGQGSCFAIELPTVDRAEVPLATGRSLDIPASNQLSPVPTIRTSSPILLAEDNSGNISTICSYLEAKGYQMVVAHNGAEAIDLAQSAHPALILMDIQMPGMDGIEAIQRIRRDPQLAVIPIIALTALAMTGDRERCLAAGANEYLSKPLKLKDLAQTIQTTLSKASDYFVNSTSNCG